MFVSSGKRPRLVMLTNSIVDWLIKLNNPKYPQLSKQVYRMRSFVLYVAMTFTRAKL